MTDALPVAERLARAEDDSVETRAREFQVDDCLLYTSMCIRDRGDGIHSYMVYEDGVFTTKDIDGNVLETLDIRRG